MLPPHRNKYQVISWEFAPQKLNHWVPKDECVSFCLAAACPPRTGLGARGGTWPPDRQLPWHAWNGLCRGLESPGDIPSSVKAPIGNFKLNYCRYQSSVIGIELSCCSVLRSCSLLIGLIFKKICKKITLNTNKTQPTSNQPTKLQPKKHSWNKKYCKCKGTRVFRNFQFSLVHGQSFSSSWCRSQQQAGNVFPFEKNIIY